MSGAATSMAVAVSIAGIAYLTATDPKRRRAFHRAPPASRQVSAGWVAILVPGILLPFWSGGAGLVIWFGTVSVAGWIIAAVPPTRTSAFTRRAVGAFQALGTHVSALSLPSLPRWTRIERGQTRIDRLEARVAHLEAEIAALRGHSDEGHGVVLELARPARR